LLLGSELIRCGEVGSVCCVGRDVVGWGKWDNP